MSASEFFNMGGYAFYVWASYGLVLGLMIVNFIPPILQERKLLRQITRRLRREES